MYKKRGTKRPELITPTTLTMMANIPLLIVLLGTKIVSVVF